VLFDEGLPASHLPVCDHYAGEEHRMHKSMALQAEMGQDCGHALFDVTLDCEDGAAAGGEADHAALIAELLNSSANVFKRVGVRLHPVAHPAFALELQALLPKAADSLAYLMLPKLRSAYDVNLAAQLIDRFSGGRSIPLHGLIETHAGLAQVQAIAAHPRIESLSFGLMDFVSAHRGAIPLNATTARGQFEHPLVTRAKLEISAACHTHGKAPSHCVITEYKDHRAVEHAASMAARQYGYTRMWSIHPDQIRIIIDAFAPVTAEVDLAAEVLLAAHAVHWAPVAHHGVLHDRATYRYHWHVLERARRTGQEMPAEAISAFFKEIP
jgi:citrate lyase subunit beta/citryl-CoA lyase